MTLKEKFDALIPIEFGGMQDPLLSNCVEVADEFAIGFAKWYNEILADDEFKEEKSKEILEIYKKEKGL
jgi:hypothetical protein